MQMSSNPIFMPVQGSEKQIQDTMKQAGYLYFATDTGRMFLDTTNEDRISVGGGSGAAIFYGTAETVNKNKNDDYYTIAKTYVPEGIPKVDDLILNADGGFYKIKTITEESYICQLLSVSGTGGGIAPGPSAENIPTIRLTTGQTNLINGQEAYFQIEGKSATYSDGVTPIDTTLYVTFSLGTRISNTQVNNYKTVTTSFTTDETGKFSGRVEFGTYAKPSASSVLSVYIWGENHDAPSATRTATIVTSALKLSQLSSYSPANRYSVNGLTISCNVIGEVNKRLTFYYDNKEIAYKNISETDSNTNPSFTIPAGAYNSDGNPIPGTATHGHHTVKLTLCQILPNGEMGLFVEPLEYEIAVVDNSASAPPVIWLGDYKDIYYTYDTIQIPFLVWDPAHTTETTVHLYKNKIEQAGSPRTIKDFTQFNYWEIADADFDQQNYYQISCGETIDRYVEREIQFSIEVDPNRKDFDIEKGNLKLNFTATGRSNSEPAAKRSTWQYELEGEKKYADFADFNWYNNGWNMDDSINTSYIRISNGAKLTIPYKSMTFASTSSDAQSHTVEMQLKISNIQKYDNLITNITRYKNDGDYYTKFKEQQKTGYANYDIYLQKTLSADVYEALTDTENFDKVEKVIQTNNIAAGLYDIKGNNVTGFCVGTQDAFFSNGIDTVNVNFVENELINLSFVYQHSLKQLYIYINGCITGVIKSSVQSGSTFTIENTNLIFDSKYCDIDLYKVRIYQTDLNVNQIITNFAVDRKDIDLFDQRTLAMENQVLKEYQLSYDSMIRYNDTHPNAPLMPYIIFDTGAANSKLPYSKEDTKNVTVEFVNTPLELAYTNGRLEQLAKQDGLCDENEIDGEVIKEAVKLYYKHHCPSFTSSLRVNDKVKFEVQGTSSQFYPRRNYKIKTKMDGKFNWKDNEELDEEDRTDEGGAFTESEGLNIFMNRGPYAEDFVQDQKDIAKNPKLAGYEKTRLSDGWYMNNYTNPTDRWTMKVDYMESSGSYNAGFASLVGNGYTKHPLQDYINNGVILNKGELKTPINTIDKDSEGMRWQDYRTSLLGFPVMAFWRRGSGDAATYTFIGYYRMLLDKSSTQVLGFKTPKKVMHSLFPKKYNDDGSVAEYHRLRDIAECWEFSNNARGFCSYRDPWNRVELSFKAPAGVKNEYTADGAPVVANSFEYRYHSKDDFIDVLYKFDNATQSDLDKVAQELGLPANSIIKDNRESGADALLTTYQNWEKVCKWLWSTNIDAVDSQGKYREVPVGNVEYKTDGTFFVIDENNEYIASTEPFDVNKVYYMVNTGSDKEQVPYIQVDAAPADYVYSKGKFYYQTAGYNTSDVEDDIYAIANDDYDGSIKYYTFEDDAIENFDTRFDLLVRKVNTAVDTFDINGPMMQASIYHTYNSNRNYFVKDENNEYVAWIHSDISEPQFMEEFKTALEAGLYFRDKYYTWHGTDYDVNNTSKQVVIKKGSATGAVQEVIIPNASDWNAGIYYVFNPIIYAGKEYTHDTKEYRTAKFTNEFEDHFDPEYVATYFIMTEVMECYDSRGKNCMMASWGPLKEGGDYIWYPIFYDIDTQLGINNTGIPSFQYNVDATEAGNYSTSDSILWNNFFKFFKKTWMLPKYQNLRGFNSKFDQLYESDGVTKKAPLQSIDYIEKWYTFDPSVTNNIACEGVRPLIGTNLDMYFKYITITNAKAKDQGVAHLNDAGEYADPDSGTYFYALQGDRSQSRRQFVTSRLEYIDSWLTQGNYARGGANRLWGRISANNNVLPDVHSDKWVENKPNKLYWKNDIEFGEKTHEFDAEYWLEPIPIRSSYFTAGDDSANYPSQKYDGVNPLKFKLSELENGIRISSNYPEQLLYIYGTNQMADFGDLSKLYWTEFKLEGNADKLTRLKLGHDGKIVDYADDNATEKTEIGWYNKKLNGITLPNLPLLKEANFCNIGLINATSLDFSGSEKLENFRATGSSNITSVKFADGVALNTLYAPSTLTKLSLTQANLLTDLILPKPTDEVLPALAVNQSYYETPVANEATGHLEAIPGLYLEGFFSDTASSSLTGINFDGGNLGYNSYVILQRLFDRSDDNDGAQITMTDVHWSPYDKLTEGHVYNPNSIYYKDNGHYGYIRYDLMEQVAIDAVYSAEKSYYSKANNVYTIYTGGLSNFTAAVNNGLYTYDIKQFNADILSNLVYIDNGHGGRNADGSFSTIINSINDASKDMLKTLYEDSKFKNGAGEGHPNITGLIYINNDIAVNEADIITLQSYYPNLTFFFKKVNQAYSAKFVIFDPDDYSEKYVKWANGSTSPSVQKIQSYSDTIYFSNPFDAVEGYKPEKTHYDFVGWSLDERHPYDENGNLINDLVITIEEGTREENNLWNAQKLIQDKYDYTYYAIFKLRKYEIRCYNNNNPAYGEYTDENGQKYNMIRIEYGQPLSTTGIIMPQATTATEFEERNAFRGWTLNKNAGKVYTANEKLDDIIINLSKYSVVKDYSLYAVFQNESVYDSVTDDKYFIYTYDKGYPVINLNPETGNDLSGKITLPAKDSKGNDILGIGLFASYYADGQSTSSTPNKVTGEHITHIFFEEGSNYKYIENYAFFNPSVINDNYELEAIKLPESITTIGIRSFQSRLSEKLTYIQGLTNAQPSEKITSIADYAFSGGIAKTNTIPMSKLPPYLTHLGKNAFSTNSGITFDEIPNGIKELPEECFYNCPNININIFGGKDSQLTTIRKRCFRKSGANNETPITELRFGKKVTVLEEDAFTEYGDVNTITSPNSMDILNWDFEAIFGKAAENITFNQQDIQS